MYRTRAKAVSSKPIFNAGTERFMRDWRSGIVTVTVRDQRYRQHDPVLGVIPLKLSDILQSSSQVTRWYPLDGGIVSHTLPFVFLILGLTLQGIWTCPDLFTIPKHGNETAPKYAWLGRWNIRIYLRQNTSAQL